MLPHIYTEDRHRLASLAEGVILVGAGGDAQGTILAGVEPCPPRAKAAKRRLLQLILQGVHVTEAPLDGRLQHTFRRRGWVWRHDGEVEVMIVESATVVADDLAKGFVLYRPQRSEQNLDRCVKDARLLCGLVQNLGVCRMVLGIVRLHRQRVDMRLQCVKGIGQLYLLVHDVAPLLLGMTCNKSTHI